MKSSIDRDHAESEGIIRDIAKPVQPRVWNDYLLILCFGLTFSVLTFALK